jgi:integrase
MCRGSVGGSQAASSTAPGQGSHDLRHSCASLLYSQGVPLDQIQDILGHESPTTTKMIYVDVAEEIQRDAMDRLDFLFEDPEE